MPWLWTVDSLMCGLAAGAAGAAAGWGCAGFALHCCRLLAPAAHVRPDRVGILSPETAASMAWRAGLARIRGARRRPVRRRACGATAWLMPGMAGLSAGIFFLLAVRHGFTWVFLTAAAAASGLLVLAVIDARTGLLPDALNLPLLWAGLAQAWLAGAASVHAAVAGAMLGYGLLYGLCLGFGMLTGRDGMGHGDFKLAAALGAWLGPWTLLHALLGASLLAVVYAACRARTRSLSAVLPFGPFLAAAGISAIVLLPELHLGFWRAD
ncbi:MAG TPA: A24 family peptidase [Eoetvoesiella sp.]|uniref:prepilin peptidase n=1 Tax=Eoetvoesiella sp. TaxID=1966355 RepID=UPI002BFA08D3|nr:A24 family peptidase [Eoetvoesiella sp.]HWK62484.1 A24 family peptidase [Eoetvoesiella sp.]